MPNAQRNKNLHKQQQQQKTDNNSGQSDQAVIISSAEIARERERKTRTHQIIVNIMNWIQKIKGFAALKTH